MFRQKSIEFLCQNAVELRIAHQQISPLTGDAERFRAGARLSGIATIAPIRTTPSGDNVPSGPLREFLKKPIWISPDIAPMR